MEDVLTRKHVTRREYDEWINEAVGLAHALRYPITPDMINDSAGIVFGVDQYQAFEHGICSREPYEIMFIFESLIEGAVDVFPAVMVTYLKFGSYLDMLCIVNKVEYILH